MKAIYHDQFGPPDVLELRGIDPPTAGPAEVLVEVHAAGVIPATDMPSEVCHTQLG